MSDKLRREIAVERGLLSRLPQTHKALRECCAEEELGPVEISALAAMLHSFYTGVENVLKRIAVHIDGGPPHGPAWHSRLLDRMAEGMERRPAVISDNLTDSLRACSIPPYVPSRLLVRAAVARDETVSPGIRRRPAAGRG